MGLDEFLALSRVCVDIVELEKLKRERNAIELLGFILSGQIMSTRSMPKAHLDTGLPSQPSMLNQCSTSTSLGICCGPRVHALRWDVGRGRGTSPLRKSSSSAASSCLRQPPQGFQAHTEIATWRRLGIGKLPVLWALRRRALVGQCSHCCGSDAKRTQNLR